MMKILVRVSHRLISLVHHSSHWLIVLVHHWRELTWLVLFIGLIVGTVGWLGWLFSIPVWWFEIAGFVMVIPTAIVLKLTDRRRRLI